MISITPIPINFERVVYIAVFYLSNTIRIIQYGFFPILSTLRFFILTSYFHSDVILVLLQFFRIFLSISSNYRKFRYLLCLFK